jgi:hypothetical protein
MKNAHQQPTVEALIARAIANDYIAEIADGSVAGIAEIAATVAAEEWASAYGLPPQTVDLERINQVARELAKHAAEVQRAHRGTAGAFAKVCRTCGRTSAQVSFPRLSTSTCTPCDSERKQARNSRISARGARVVPMLPPSRSVKENPKHLAWVRLQPCAVHQLFCDGPVQAHHVRSAGSAGTGCKPADSATVPLCAAHHAELHRNGAQTFDAEHGVCLRDLAKQMAERSPHVASSIKRATSSATAATATGIA